MSNPTGDALVAAGIKDTQKLSTGEMYRPFCYDTWSESGQFQIHNLLPRPDYRYRSICRDGFGDVNYLGEMERDKF